MLTAKPSSGVEPETAILSCVPCFVSVSYTHLDVYKRQVLYIIRRYIHESLFYCARARAHTHTQYICFNYSALDKFSLQNILSVGWVAVFCLRLLSYYYRIFEYVFKVTSLFILDYPFPLKYIPSVRGVFITQDFKRIFVYL